MTCHCTPSVTSLTHSLQVGHDCTQQLFPVPLRFGQGTTHRRRIHNRIAFVELTHQGPGSGGTLGRPHVRLPRGGTHRGRDTVLKFARRCRRQECRGCRRRRHHTILIIILAVVREVPQLLGRRQCHSRVRINQVLPGFVGVTQCRTHGFVRDAGTAKDRLQLRQPRFLHRQSH